MTRGLEPRTAAADTGTTVDGDDSAITTEVVTESLPQELNAEGGHGAVPLEGVPTEQAPIAAGARDWPLWEVFVRAKRGLSHVHVGSLHAPDAPMAIRNARDLYTRRQEGVSIWVMPAEHIAASSPDEKDAFFDPAADKIYRHPTFYSVPEGVEHL